MTQLLPCPFCGAPAQIGSEEPFFRPDRFMFYVFHSHPYPPNCPFHKSGSLATDFFDTEEEATRAWNNQKAAAGVAILLKALEEIEPTLGHGYDPSGKETLGEIARAAMAIGRNE